MGSKQDLYEWEGMILTTGQLTEALGLTPKNFRRKRGQGKLLGDFVMVPRPTQKLSSGHPLYPTYNMMKQRCSNQNHRNYRHYGGRSIKVCDRWLTSFENYVLDIETSLGPKKLGMTLDRIDNDGNYELSNMRWATAKQQTDNRRTRKDALWVTDGQKSQGLADWARELGVPRLILRQQILEGRHPFLTLLGRYGELYQDR